MYSLNKVAPCKIEPQNVEISKVKGQIFNRFFRGKLETTMCRASHQNIRWYCGLFDASGIDAKRSTITTDVDLTPEQCRQARLTNKLSINGKEIPIKLNVRTTFIKNSGPNIGENPNECDDSGWIIHDTFETYMQDTTLNVNLRGGSVNNWQNIPLPCTLSEGGCQSTSTDPHAYSWEKQDNCLFALREQFEGKMIKIGDNYYISKESAKEQSFLFQVYNKPQSLCNSNNIVYPSPYDTIYVEFTGGFNMNTGEALEPLPNINRITRLPNNSLSSLNISRTEIDYEAHLNTKFDYYQYTNFRRLQLSEINTIQQICELERSLKNTQLAYSRLSPKLAGFLLTNNRSMFLETNGNIAWLYHCPKFYSPLQVMDTCYDRIPVLYKNKVRFIDPVSRQTFTTAKQQPCNNKQKNLFQLDIENDNSWIELTPSITQVTGPALFAPSNQKHKMVSMKFKNGQEVSFHVKEDMIAFWNDVTLNSEMKDAAQEFSRELVEIQHNKSQPSGYSNYYTTKTIYLDSLISSQFLHNRYIKTFGRMHYYLEQCGITFAVFLFVKFIIDIVVCIIRALQIHKISGASVSFGKVILSATFNILFQSIVTSVFRPTEERDDSEHLVQAPTYKEPTINIYPPIQSELQSIRQERENHSSNDDFPTSPV